MFELFEQLVTDDINATNTYEGDEKASPRSRTVLCRDLPHLLQEFERKRGTALVEEESRTQLEEFCRQIPEQPIACDDLVKMILNLESALTLCSTDPLALSSSDRATTDDEDCASDSSRSSGPLSLSDLPSATSPIETSPRPFPRSQSESLDLTVSHRQHSRHPNHNRPNRTSLSDLDSHRSRTSSTSAMESQRDSTGSRRTRRRSQIDSTAANTTSEDRDIFRGKGRAPPSSWQRPRPQALAARSRRTSDVSRSSDNIAENQEDGSLTLRYRQSSQPVDAAEHVGEEFTRSVSSGYVFPRTTSPGHTDEKWYKEQEDYWERMSTERVERARSNTSRAGSPELDSPSFQPFGALGSTASPISPRIRQGLGTSASGRAMYDNLTAETEAFGTLQRRYDNLVRTLQEKERSFESTQGIHETTIVELEAKVEELQERMHGVTRTNDEMRQKEQRYLDEISRLESDLATSQKRGDNAERIKEVMQQDLSYRETSIATLQGKITDLQERINAAERDEAEHFGRQQEWDHDREQYRSQLEDIRGQLQHALDKEARMEELDSEREALQAQVRDLHMELEEARRGSGFLPLGGGMDSKPGTFSLKTGTSLGSELRDVWHAQPEVDQSLTTGDESGSDVDPDASLESVVITTTRRRKQGSTKHFQEGSTQTDLAEPSHNTVGSSESSPPSYDEAATEKLITGRTHPNVATTTEAEHLPLIQHRLLGILGIDSLASSSAMQRYHVLSRHLGTRCTIFEDALVRSKKSPEVTDASMSTRRCLSSGHFIGNTASHVLNLLPKWARDGLVTSCKSRREERLFGPSPSSRLIMAGSGILVVGVFMGKLLSPGTTHYHYYGSSGMMEDSLTWHLSNSLNLGLGSPHVEYASDPSTSGQGLLGGLLGRWLTRSARQLAGVPL